MIDIIISMCLLVSGFGCLYFGIKRLIAARRLCWIANTGLYNYIELGLEGDKTIAYFLRDGTFGSRLAKNINFEKRQNPQSDVIKYAKYDDMCEPGFNRKRIRVK